MKEETLATIEMKKSGMSWFLQSFENNVLQIAAVVKEKAFHMCLFWGNSISVCLSILLFISLYDLLNSKTRRPFPKIFLVFAFAFILFVYVNIVLSQGYAKKSMVVSQ